MSAPADHQAGRQVTTDHASIAQDAKYGVGDARPTAQVEMLLFHQFVIGENNIAQGGEQVAADALDHLAIDKGLGRAVVQLQFQAPGFRDDGDLEVTVKRIEFAGIVHIGAGVEYGQCASAEQLVYLFAR